MFCKRSSEAEQILLQAKLYYRAIKMNIRLFKWERALDLAVTNKTHVDTVIAYRQQYLERVRQTEKIQKFMALKDEVEIDWVTIKTKIKQDKEKEAMGGRPYEG
jgi:intraflagellar transport protein 80